MEIWKPFPTEPKYLISNLGRIKGVKGNIRKTTIAPNGYERLNLSISGKKVSYMVHRVVAETFLENFTPSCCIDHINGIKNDNRVENLRVVTQSINIAHRDENWNEILEKIKNVIHKVGYEKTLEFLSIIENQTLDV